MNFPLYIAKRYLFSKSKNNAINIITGIASIGIIVGTLALFVVLSVFSGLRDFSLSFSNSIDPDLKVNPIQGKTFFISPKQEKEIATIEGIASYSKVVEERVLFFFDGKEQVTYLKGVDVNYTKINSVSKNLFNGKWLRYKTAEVVVGYGITQKLSLGLFDFNNDFEVYVPRKGKAVIESEAEAFNKSVLIPIGIYAISEDLDGKYVFADLTLAQDLLEYKHNEISGFEIKIKDKDTVSGIVEAILYKGDSWSCRMGDDSKISDLKIINVGDYEIEKFIDLKESKPFTFRLGEDKKEIIPGHYGYDYNFYVNNTDAKKKRLICSIDSRAGFLTGVFKINDTVVSTNELPARQETIYFNKIIDPNVPLKITYIPTGGYSYPVQLKFKLIAI